MRGAERKVVFSEGELTLLWETEFCVLFARLELQVNVTHACYKLNSYQMSISGN